MKLPERIGDIILDKVFDGREVKRFKTTRDVLDFVEDYACQRLYFELGIDEVRIFRKEFEDIFERMEKILEELSGGAIKRIDDIYFISWIYPYLSVRVVINGDTVYKTLFSLLDFIGEDRADSFNAFIDLVLDLIHEFLERRCKDVVEK